MVMVMVMANWEFLDKKWGEQNWTIGPTKLEMQMTPGVALSLIANYSDRLLLIRIRMRIEMVAIIRLMVAYTGLGPNFLIFFWLYWSFKNSACLTWIVACDKMCEMSWRFKYQWVLSPKMCSGPLGATWTRIQLVLKPSRHFANVTYWRIGKPKRFWKKIIIT